MIRGGCYPLLLYTTSSSMIRGRCYCLYATSGTFGCHKRFRFSRSSPPSGRSYALCLCQFVHHLPHLGWKRSEGEGGSKASKLSSLGQKMDNIIIILNPLWCWDCRHGSRCLVPHQAPWTRCFHMVNSGMHWGCINSLAIHLLACWGFLAVFSSFHVGWDYIIKGSLKPQTIRWFLCLPNHAGTTNRNYISNGYFLQIILSNHMPSFSIIYLSYLFVYWFPCRPGLLSKKPFLLSSLILVAHHHFV